MDSSGNGGRLTPGGDPLAKHGDRLEVGGAIGAGLAEDLVGGIDFLARFGEAAIPLGLLTLGVGFSGFRVERWSIGIVGALLCPLSSLIVLWPLLGVFDQTSPLAAAFAAPIALWELALGLWLTFRGFRADAVERLV